MKMPESFKTEKFHNSFLGVLLLVLLAIMPKFGGAAMLVAAVIEAAVYTALFSERLVRQRFRRVALSFAVGTAAAVVAGIIMGWR